MVDKIAKRVMKYIHNNAELVNRGQGHITIGCVKLWDMSDKEFKQTFIK